VTYATLAQLTDRYGEEMLVRLTDRAALPTHAIDETVVNRALADADALIDGYLQGRYVLPLVATPPLLTDIALAITIWKLHVYKPDEKIEADYKAAEKQLAQIASGTIRLSVAGVEPADEGGGGAVVTDRERPFTPESLTGFI
jgi:phage gp36-like protein